MFRRTGLHAWLSDNASVGRERSGQTPAVPRFDEQQSSSGLHNHDRTHQDGPACAGNDGRSLPDGEPHASAARKQSRESVDPLLHQRRDAWIPGPRRRNRSMAAPERKLPNVIHSARLDLPTKSIGGQARVRRGCSQERPATTAWDPTYRRRAVGESRVPWRGLNGNDVPALLLIARVQRQRRPSVVARTAASGRRCRSS